MSKDIKIDGQLNFLEMMGAYTDGSGASVSVSKPRTEIRGRKGSGTGITVKDGSPISGEAEQLSFDLDILTVDGQPSNSSGSGFVVKELEKIEIDNNRKIKATYTEVREPEPVQELPQEPETVPEVVAAPESETVPEVAAEPEPEVEPEPAAEPEPVKKKVPKLKKKAEGPVALFEKCADCWCSDCKHNSRNEGKPREMCGMMMACPACEACLEQGYAEVCEIGSAKEGCKTRAMEEGLVEEESI